MLLSLYKRVGQQGHTLSLGRTVPWPIRELRRGTGRPMNLLRKYLHFSTWAKHLLGVLIWAAFFQPAEAREPSVKASRYIPGRALSMGGAFLPLADDGASSLMLNPAAFGKIRRPHFELFNVQLEPNTEFTNMMNTRALKVLSLSEYQHELGAHSPAFPGVGFSLFPNFSFKGLGFGVMYRTNLSAQQRDGHIFYESLYQLIPTAGIGVRLASGIIRLGYSVQWIHQVSANRQVAVSDTDIGYTEGAHQGHALSHTLGFSFTLPYQYLPAFNLVARNIGRTRFASGGLLSSAKNSPGPPPDEPFSVDASLSFHPKTGSGGVFNLVLEGRDITNRYGMPLFSRIHLGAELNFKRIFYLRAGLGAGYPSFGIGLRRPTAEFSLGYSSIEVGDSYRDEKDSRITIHYQIRAF